MARDAEKVMPGGLPTFDQMPGAVERVLLRKDVLGVRRLAASLMPSFAEGLKPADVADLLAWLRSHLETAK